MPDEGNDPTITIPKETMQPIEATASEDGRTVQSLPPRPADMVVRDGPRLALHAALEPDRSIVVVHGMGGAGKTWLALDVANEVRGTRLFADVVWATARDAALTFDAWLRLILRSLSRADLAVLSTDQLEPQVAGLLNQQAILLVVDDFESVAAAEQDKILDLARWMMPPSRILLTSRHVDFLERLPAGSASPNVVALGGLSRAETQRLFFEEVGRQGAVVLQLLSDAQITGIYEVTGGNPFAVRLLVAEALTRPLEAVLDELRQTPHDVLDTLFVRSWNRLTEGAQLVLQSACVLSGPVSHESLAEMTGLSQEEVARAVINLQAVSLIESRSQHPGGPGLVGLHPLTRAFVGARLEETDGLNERLMDRAVTRYLDLVGRHGGFLDEPGHQRIEQELAAILGIRDWCHQRGRHLQLLQFGQWLGNYFWVRGYWRERIRSGELAHRAAEDLGFEWEEGEILSRELGWSHLQLDEPDLALGYLDRARLLLQRVGHIDEVASCWRYLGQIALRKHDLTTCQKLLGLALATASGLIDEHDRAYAVARTRVDLGYLALKQGDAAGAASEFQQAVDFFRHVGDKIRMGYGLNGLGDAALANTNLVEAEAHYLQSLEIADRFGSRPDRARALIRLARLHGKLGDRKRAMQEAAGALDVARRLGLPAEVRDAERVLNVRPLGISLDECRVWVYGVEVHLEPQAVKLLELLESKAGTLCSYAEICGRVWPGESATIHNRANVNRLVFDIRRAIAPYASEAVIVKTVPRRGYRLEISVRPDAPLI